MPAPTIEDIRNVMDKTDNIRSMSVIAHVDHGKSTLSDSLVSKAGLISEERAGTARTLDNRPDEQERGVTIKSTGITLYYEVEVEEGRSEPYLINLIDSPGHVDFSSEVTAALRITDGACVVVDCIEGCAVQTETVLRQALQERVKPVLFVNKLDRCIMELQMDPEDMYLRLRQTIESVNVIVSTYQDKLLGDIQLDPGVGNVAFGSGLHGWAFDTDRFARAYASKFNLDKDKMKKYLWGDWYFNAKRKVWTDQGRPEGEEPLRRAFCKFIMDPISQMIKACMDGELEKVEGMLAKLTPPVKLTQEDRNKEPKALMKCVMKLWINVADTLLHLIILQLPSPKAAQKYRVENLYEGPMDDEAANAIRNCDPTGELMMYVSKMVPASEKGRFYAFGRVFSGTIAAGQKVRIQGPNYQPGKKDDLNVKVISRTVLMMGQVAKTIRDVPCGNTVALVGIDQYLVKSGTLTTIEDAHNIKAMKYSVSPVVKVAIKAKDGKDLPKIVEGLKKLAKSDPLVVCTVEESGEQVIAGCGELHLEICLKDLGDYSNCEFTVSDPVVNYRETVTTESTVMALSKSPNKHNRLYMKAEPLGDEVSQKIEDGDLGVKADPKERAKTLRDSYDWEDAHSKKIWCYGPETTGANVVVDVTQGVQYLAEIKEHVVSGMQWASKEGPLCEEPMRGIRFNIHDVHLHTDSIHRGAGQIMPAARRCLYASELTAKPTLQEPVFLVEITCPVEAASGVYSTLSMRRGHVFEENIREGTPLVQMKGYLPVADSFGFVADLRQQTSGQAFPQCVFDHWDNLAGSIDNAGDKLVEKILSIRRRKHLKEQMPDLADYLDKL